MEASVLPQGSAFAAAGRAVPSDGGQVVVGVRAVVHVGLAIAVGAIVAIIATRVTEDTPEPKFVNAGLDEASKTVGYLVQSVCLDAGRTVTDRLPFDLDCIDSRPMSEDDRLLWRKHDWGGSKGSATGWQASDAVLARRDGISFVDQTFDFGAPATDNDGRLDAFSRFDANDGGDAIMVVGDTASVFLTQDGGTPGLQWFIGSDCGQPSSARYLSWLLFRSDASAEWHSLVARLSRVSKDRCPSRFSQAFTRYKLAPETFPFRMGEGSGSPARRSVTLPTIISEHYDRATLAASESMERFYYASQFGKLRWEAWSTDERKTVAAQALDGSGRCPTLADSTAPTNGWRMVDCRMWTNIIFAAAPASWHVRDFNWPPDNLTLR